MPSLKLDEFLSRGFFFTLNICAITTLLILVFTGVSASDDLEIGFFIILVFVLPVVVSSSCSFLPFAIKNLFTSIRHPDSLAVCVSDEVSLLNVNLKTVLLFQAVNQLCATEGMKKNITLQNEQLGSSAAFDIASCSAQRGLSARANIDGFEKNCVSRGESPSHA